MPTKSLAMPTAPQQPGGAPPPLSPLAAPAAEQGGAYCLCPWPRLRLQDSWAGLWVRGARESQPRAPS